MDMLPLQSQPHRQPHRSRLAIRLVARDGRAMILRRTLLPVIGVDDIILPAFDDTLGAFAIRAQEGDTDARDALFFAFLPKLDRLMANVRPPYALAGMTGTWDRDDVEQEAYLVFVELLHAWSGDVSFTAWLLSRFPWRLKDAIRDGVGKSPVPPRHIQVPIEVADKCPSLFLDPGPDIRETVDALMDSLPSYLARVLVARALLGKNLAQIGRERGLSRRTMVRYWQEIHRRALDLLDNPV
jgi:DNA-directed RNA polymerase specialized sigma24 family protein